jgi:hypothetical protein
LKGGQRIKEEEEQAQYLSITKSTQHGIKTAVRAKPFFIPGREKKIIEKHNKTKRLLSHDHIKLLRFFFKRLSNVPFSFFKLAKGKLNFAWDGKLRVARHTSGKKLMKPKSGKERNAHHFIVLFLFSRKDLLLVFCCSFKRRSYLAEANGSAQRSNMRN